MSALEKLILNAVRARLDVHVLVLWDRQVGSINKVQRLPNGVEVNFYRMRNGKVRLDPAMAFPNKTEELLIAKVTLDLASQRLISKVWAVNGYVFSIEHVGGSQYFEEMLGMDPVPEFGIHCDLLVDLSQVG
ncbi:hypothetical protein [Xanthomonas theicola]|uniref:hypothetical protein n=1 Tax=Xanthomonas theicola TaxID=56464 RepID=UPI000FF8A9B5|nr:hypothetical protein [Xanthomonas theicola]QNH23552.1 hypothetical protein G4Q83_00385 [Xanthomonas theicola]